MVEKFGYLTADGQRRTTLRKEGQKRALNDHSVPRTIERIMKHLGVRYSEIPIQELPHNWVAPFTAWPATKLPYRTRRARRIRDQEVFARAKFYKQLLGEGKMIFDVGANVGNRVAAFLQIHSRVIAIEPQMRCAEELCRKFEGNSDLIIIQKALGGATGQTLLQSSSDLDVLATTSAKFAQYVRTGKRFEAAQLSRRQIVEMTTLDELIRVHGLPDFIKIDVEGYEAEVIKGLSQCPACLSFEFTADYQDDIPHCLQLCDNLGLVEFNISYGESMRFAREKWISASRILRHLEALQGDSWLFGELTLGRLAAHSIFDAKILLNVPIDRHPLLASQ